MRTRQVAMRWPVDLLAQVDGAAGPGGRTAFVLDAVRAALDGSAPAPSPEAPKPEPRRGGYLASRPAASVGPPPAGPAPGARQRCPHPKARRSRGQCLACMEHVG